MGVSAAKSRISRKTGIPLTKSGRQRKVGRMVTGGGCFLPVLMGIFIAVAACGGGTIVEQPIGVVGASLETEPSEAPEFSFKPLAVKKVSVTSPVARGGTAKVVIKTVPKAKCFISVDYDSGPSTAAGLDDKIADSSGKVAWSWKVGLNTTPGTTPIYIGCGNRKAFGTIDLEFRVK